MLDGRHRIEGCEKGGEERMRRYEEVPDLVLESKDSYKEKLEFTLKASKVLIHAGVDGVGQSWVVDKKLLKGRLKL